MEQLPAIEAIVADRPAPTLLDSVSDFLACQTAPLKHQYGLASTGVSTRTTVLDFCEQGTGNGPEAQALARKMARAWANFARTGNPSQPGLKWDPFEPTRCQTMVFDDNCGMMDDPEGEVRKLLLA